MVGGAERRFRRAGMHPANPGTPCHRRAPRCAAAVPFHPRL